MRVFRHNESCKSDLVCQNGNVEAVGAFFRRPWERPIAPNGIENLTETTAAETRKSWQRLEVLDSQD